MKVNFIMIPVYVNDIKRSLENKCYFSALSLTLMLPDICGMVEFPDKSVAERYMGWYDKYLGDYMAYSKNDQGENNQEKFKLNFDFITQEDLLHPSEEVLQFSQDDVLVKLLNQKSEKEGNTKRYVGISNRSLLLAEKKEVLNDMSSDEVMKHYILNGEAIYTFSNPLQPMGLVETENIDVKVEA